MSNRHVRVAKVDVPAKRFGIWGQRLGKIFKLLPEVEACDSHRASKLTQSSGQVGTLVEKKIKAPKP